MKILALESSAVSASVALTEDEKLVAQSFQNCGLTHSRTLLPMVENLLANCGVSLSDVDAIAVAHGPGSFTGVRIGVATVKGLALGADKPCLGVSTLEAMAWGARALGGDLCCVMDARAGQVYNALFTVEDGKVRLPFCSLKGLGGAAADALENVTIHGEEYLSIEELQQASGVGSSIIDRLRQVGALGELPESSQVSFF